MAAPDPPTLTISLALSNLPASLSSSNDFEIGSSHTDEREGYHRFFPQLAYPLNQQPKRNNLVSITANDLVMSAIFKRSTSGAEIGLAGQSERVPTAGP